MKILALITARGGSKRLPGKNIRMLGGKPLLVWSIDVISGIPDICDVLVSTDSAAIAQVGRGAGALVPWLRPTELATDSATSAAVALHALDWYERERTAIDGLLLLQPTTPFRRRETIDRGMRLFAQGNRRTVVGVSPADSHPLWCFRLEGDSMQPFVEAGEARLRSQELPPAYAINGAFYLISPADLRRHQSFYSEVMLPLIIDRPEESIDIDTEFDWKIAEAMISSR